MDARENDLGAEERIVSLVSHFTTVDLGFILSRGVKSSSTPERLEAGRSYHSKVPERIQNKGKQFIYFQPIPQEM